ncbi:uncharacterized protein F5891DRAFT_1195197 [Suillus fuscotomentosus]|uniref:F-box domain-containing protein n=1 Tax=Suillus fuscotomentosus TaxID=1912939 RepID=A0AAD4HFE1_9AGAM|nr:uncharacterized protein F5891DRAFT_1195197 [Suillus fuscotomentosus]KAG1894492.1 hypothetical protein F5891DRAFT_1195197 [Suillus fuscotomentosus]
MSEHGPTLLQSKPLSPGIASAQPSPSSCSPGSPAHTMKITQNADIAATILDMLMITDITSISRTCRMMSQLGQQVVQRRLARLLVPFIGDHLSIFLSALRHLDGVITGSTMRAMVGLDEGYTVRDLNILVPHQHFDDLDATLEQTIGFTPTLTIPHLAIAPSVVQSVLHIVLSAPTTADMAFMTTGGVCYFYPEWFEERLAIQTRTGDLVPCNQKLGCAGELHDVFDVQRGTAFLRIPCGKQCPTYWHHVEDKHLRMSVDWDQDDSVTRVCHNIDVEWRLNTLCVNARCPHCVTVMMRNIVTTGASNCADVKFLPTLPPAGGRPPTLDDLDVNYWVKQRHAADCTATRRHLCRTFTKVPGSHVTLDGHYTLYVETPHPSIRRSRLLSRMASMSGSRETFQGSVLVVKQMKDTPYHLMNMTKRDQLLANFLISRSVQVIASDRIALKKTAAPSIHAHFCSKGGRHWNQMSYTGHNTQTRIAV